MNLQYTINFVCIRQKCLIPLSYTLNTLISCKRFIVEYLFTGYLIVSSSNNRACQYGLKYNKLLFANKPLILPVKIGLCSAPRFFQQEMIFNLSYHTCYDAGRRFCGFFFPPCDFNSIVFTTSK